MNKEITVSLDISCKTMNLNEISSIIGTECSDVSYNIGDFRNNRQMDHTLWRLFSDINSEYLEDHVVYMFNSMLSMSQINKLPLNDVKMSITVGVFFDYANCSVYISDKCIKLLAKYGLDLEIVYYPCNKRNGIV